MMLDLLSTYLEFIVQYIAIFFIQRYVFLESFHTLKKSRRFHMICFSVGLVICTFTDVAGFYIIFSSVLGIVLSRKAKKFRGIFLVIPIVGLLNGLLGPIVLTPGSILTINERQSVIYEICSYFVILFLMLLFFVVGKKWRNNFDKELVNRHLQTWEKVLLWIVGILLTVITSFLQTRYGNLTAQMTDEMGMILVVEISNLIIAMGISSFVLAIVIIILIMQGNRRAYYYEQTLDMERIEREREKAEAANEAKSMF